MVVAIGAGCIGVYLVQHDTCDGVVEVSVVPAVEVTGHAAGIVGRVLAGGQVAIAALQDRVIGLQGPPRGRVIEEVVGIAAVAFVTALFLVVTLVTGFVQVDVRDQAQGMGCVSMHVAACASLVPVTDAAVAVVFVNVIAVVKGNETPLLVVGLEDDQVLHVQGLLFLDGG